MRSRISYLNVYPESYLPFDRGFKENIKEAFFHKDGLTVWELETPSEVRSGIGQRFNWFDNEYYSCC